MNPDVIVVGAGVMGSSIAFHLSERGGARVLVLDQAAAGQGMSARSSALIRMHYSFPPEVQLAVKSLEIFRNWTEITGAPSRFRKTGFVRIVPSEETDRLQKNVAMQRSLGAEVQLVSPQELREIEPDWRVDDVVVAAYEPESGYGDGAGVGSDFLAAARRRGADYRAGARVRRLLVSGGAVRGVATEAGPLEADKVVVATGPWTRPLLAAVGVDVPIETEYHQVGFLKPPAWKKASTPSPRCTRAPRSGSTCSWGTSTGGGGSTPTTSRRPLPRRPWSSSRSGPPAASPSWKTPASDGA